MFFIPCLKHANTFGAKGIFSFNNTPGSAVKFMIQSVTPHPPLGNFRSLFLFVCLFFRFFGQKRKMKKKMITGRKALGSPFWMPDVSRVMSDNKQAHLVSVKAERPNHPYQAGGWRWWWRGGGSQLWAGWWWWGWGVHHDNDNDET